MAAIGLLAEPVITTSAISGQAGTYAPGDEITFTIDFENTVRTVNPNPNNGLSAAQANAQNAENTARGLSVSGVLAGFDIYGNPFEVPISTSGGNQVAPESTTTITGRVRVPLDGSFYNLPPGGYRIVLSYTYTHTDPGATSPVDGPTQTSQSNIFVDVPANIGLVDLSYPVKTYRGGDIIEITASIRNSAPPTDPNAVVRPLRSISAELFRTELFLSEDASVDRNNDFRLGAFSAFGDSAGSVDGSTPVRFVTVQGTPSVINTYSRDYVPQPDDGFLDVGETIVVTFEVLIPTNYTGTFFAAGFTDALGRISELEEGINATFDYQGDNILVDSFTPTFRIASTTTPITVPVSEVSDGNGTLVEPSNGVSDNPSMSEDGVWIAFQSFATNLDPDLPGNGNSNIYLRNRETEEITLISRSSGGVLGNRNSFNPAISADGRYIAFESLATNLVSGAQGAGSQIYVYDRLLQRVERVSISANGLAANGSCYTPSISADGRFVTYESLATNLDPAFEAALATSVSSQVFVHDRDVTNSGVLGLNYTTRLVSTYAGSPANLDVMTPKISLDGRAVVFASAASNLGVVNDGFITQIWSRELGPDGVPMGDTALVSVNTAGTAGGNGDSIEPAINGGPTATYGLQIAFASVADDLITDDTNEIADIFVRNYSVPASPVTTRVSVSNPRVAYGYISFIGPISSPPTADALPPLASANIPANQPLIGDTVTLNDGTNSVVFTFGLDVAIGANTAETRDNLVAAINNAEAAGSLNIVAYGSDAPTVNDNFNGLDGHNPTVQLMNTIPGAQGNQEILTNSLVLFDTDMTQGGTETGVSNDEFLGNPGGLVFGSLQPSLDRSGRIVAFRSLTGGISVVRDGARIFKPLSPTANTPRVGEIIRALNPNTSNVYFRDRDITGSGTLDIEENSDTARASVNKFGYRTAELSTTDSGSSRVPALSANGRFIAFASDSTSLGGLRFARTNTQPLDGNNLRDVFIYDRNVVVPTVPEEENPPFVAITNPSDGTAVSLTSPFFVNAGALGYNPVTGLFDTDGIASVTFFVNGVEVADVTKPPYSTLITPQGLGDLRIFALATDTRGNTVSSQAIRVEVLASPFEVPVIEITKPEITNGTIFSEGDTISLEATIRATANSSEFLQNFELARFDIFVNGVSVFTSTDASGTYTFDYVTDLTGNVTINAAAVYRDEIRGSDNFIIENVFSESVTINVSVFDPIGSDKDFITDSFVRLFGRVPTSNESADGVAVLDGSLDSRVAYIVDLLSSNSIETSEVALLLYRTWVGEWPDGEELEQALIDLLGDGTGITDVNALSLALVPEYEIRFSALNTQQGFVRQLFTNKHGVAPSALSEVRLFDSATGVDQFLGETTQVIPGYGGDLISFATQFALDNDISGFVGSSGLPLSNLHLYSMPNDVTADLKIALLLAAFLGENPTDLLIDSFSGMSFEEVVRDILSEYLGVSTSALPAAVNSAVSLGADWYYLDWLGSFTYTGASANSWLYSLDLGFLYLFPSSTSNDAWLYSEELGTWLYTNSGLNNWFYHWNAQQWMYVQTSNDPGAYVYLSGSWQYLNP